jgi:hypothetical protein
MNSTRSSLHLNPLQSRYVSWEKCEERSQLETRSALAEMNANIEGYMREVELDGALVGGASLDAQSIIEIVKAA